MDSLLRCGYNKQNFDEVARCIASRTRLCFTCLDVARTPTDPPCSNFRAENCRVAILSIAMAEKPYHDVLCTHVNLKEHDKLRAALEKYSPNAPAKEPRTPLLCAVTENDWESAAMLLDAGADPNFVSTSTNSTLLGRVRVSPLTFSSDAGPYRCYSASRSPISSLQRSCSPIRVRSR